MGSGVVGERKKVRMLTELLSASRRRETKWHDKYLSVVGDQFGYRPASRSFAAAPFPYPLPQPPRPVPSGRLALLGRAGPAPPALRGQCVPLRADGVLQEMIQDILPGYPTR
jgi:hypothetical protein